MVRHIEITINLDISCWAEDWEDFGYETKPNDNEYDYDEIKEVIWGYIDECPDELYEVMKINKVWYEEDE